MDAFLVTTLSSSPTLLLIVVIAASLYVLGKGADLLVDQAVSLSVSWGIPKLIIGATIVSLGTTLPEATVSVFAAIKGNPDLALGNAVGSIITNTSLIIGLAALIGKLPFDRKSISRQGKMKLFATILLVIISLPFFSQGATGTIYQWMGWGFLAILASYIYFSIKWAKEPQIEESMNEAAIDESAIVADDSPLFIQLLKLCLGITLVIIASKVLIPSVEITAVRVGIPQSIIAATLIALGTSLPELVTAITAVRKGYGELAVGNIIGANILNVLFVIGSAASVTFTGLNVPINFYKIQFPAMLIVVLAFHYFTTRKKEEITKKQGLFLFSMYIIYILLSYI